MTTPNQDLKKVCTKCGFPKHEDEFYVTKDGYRLAHCKECFRKNVYARRDKRRAEDPDAMAKEAAYMVTRRGRIKDRIFKAYGGWQCACCGETEPMFLTLDHIDNNGAEDRRQIGGRQNCAGYRTYAYLYARDFPPGYQVLCANCQHGKRMNHGLCPHQIRRNDYGESQ